MLIETILTGVIALWLGSIEIRMRTMSKDQKTLPGRKEMHDYVDIRQEMQHNQHRELKEDIKRIESKLDKVVDSLIKK